MSKFHFFLTVGLISSLTACATTPEPEPEPEPVTIITPPVRTCTPISDVERVVIPAVTKTQYAITEIENPPYEPIQRRTERTIVIEEERVIYVDSEGREVLDVCPDQIPVEG